MSTLKQQLNELPVLNQEKNLELIKKYIETKDLKIRNQIVQGNLRLTYPIASKYQIKKDMEFDDLVQEGSLGIMRAIETYNESKGAFSTYAMQWINQSMRKYWEESLELIIVPPKMFYNMQKYKVAKTDLENKLNREPTINEISEKIKLSRKIVESIQNNLFYIVSLDNTTKLENGTEYEFHETIEDKKTEVEFEAIEREELKNEINKRINNLCSVKPEKIEIYKLIFGLDGREQMKQVDINKLYKLSNQSISDLKHEINRKLSSYRTLKEFYM